jgi:hypothetical protein
MRFFEDIRGVNYPVARIRSIGRAREIDRAWPKGSKQWVHPVDLTGNEEVEICGEEWARLVGGDIIVPASPGFAKLIPVHDGATGNIDSHTAAPIIAWKIGLDAAYGVHPITPDDEGLTDAVMYPDGRVVDGDCEYDSIDAFTKSEIAKETGEGA